MKLSVIINIARYKNSVTGKQANLKKGTRVGYGTTHYFYIFRGNRIFVSANEIYGSSATWVKVDAQ